ncbi:unnamed protein product, partial [Polarella glacialis]
VVLDGRCLCIDKCCCIRPTWEATVEKPRARKDLCSDECDPSPRTDSVGSDAETHISERWGAMSLDASPSPTPSSSSGQSLASCGAAERCDAAARAIDAAARARASEKASDAAARVRRELRRLHFNEDTSMHW